MSAGAVVVWDFDHSLVNENSDTWILERLAPDLLPYLKANKHVPWTALMDDVVGQLQDRGFGRADMESALVSLPVQSGMLEALAVAKSLDGTRQFVVSDANVFYIETILRHHGVLHLFDEIVSNASPWEDGRLRVRPYAASPHGCSLCPPNLCKGAVVSQLLGAASSSSLYVGDGRGDLCPSLRLASVLGPRSVAAARSAFPLLGLLKARLPGAMDVAAMANGHQGGEYKGQIKSWSTGADMLAIMSEFCATAAALPTAAAVPTGAAAAAAAGAAAAKQSKSPHNGSAATGTGTENKPTANGLGEAPAPSTDRHGRGSRCLCCVWAPLAIPCHRRVETLSVLAVMCLLPIVSCIVLFLLWWSPAVTYLRSREVFAIYCVWAAFFDRRLKGGGAPSACVKAFPLWRGLTAYFPTRLHVPHADRFPAAPGDGEREEAPKFVFGLHPHGIISTSGMCNFVFDADPAALSLLGRVERRFATVSFHFLIPVWREIVIALGFVPADRGVLEAVLRSGASPFIVVGGAREALLAQPGSTEILLDHRKGFVRLALKHGAALVPVYMFGENDLWSQARSPCLRALQDAMIAWCGFTMPLVQGRGLFQYNCGILPQRRELNTVVGAPLPLDPSCQVGEEPTEAQVDAMHERYKVALNALYQEHRGRFAVQAPENLVIH